MLRNFTVGIRRSGSSVIVVRAIIGVRAKVVICDKNYVIISVLLDNNIQVSMYCV